MSTLIEKLEQVIVEHNAEFNKIIKDATDHQKIAHTAVLVGLLSAIKVAKQRSEWISVDERLPEPNKLVLVAIHRPQYYVPDFMYVTTADYDEVRKKWSSINLVDDLHNVVYWQPFPQLPKPPSEVQP